LAAPEVVDETIEWLLYRHVSGNGEEQVHAMPVGEVRFNVTEGLPIQQHSMVDLVTGMRRVLGLP
jgi:hypothetical protein